MVLPIFGEVVMLHKKKREIASDQVAEQPRLIIIDVDAGIEIKAMPNAASGGRRKKPVKVANPVEHTFQCAAWVDGL